MDGELWAARMANSKRHHHNFQPSHSSAHLGVWFIRVLVSVGVLNQFPLVWSPSLLGFPSTSESTPQPVILLFQSFFFFSFTVIYHHCCCCWNSKQDGYGSLSLTDRWIWVGKRVKGLVHCYWGNGSWGLLLEAEEIVLGFLQIDIFSLMMWMVRIKMLCCGSSSWISHAHTALKTLTSHPCVIISKMNTALSLHLL